VSCCLCASDLFFFLYLSYLLPISCAGLASLFILAPSSLAGLLFEQPDFLFSVAPDGAIRDRTCMNMIECVVFCLLSLCPLSSDTPSCSSVPKNGGRRSNDACRAECAGEKKWHVMVFFSHRISFRCLLWLQRCVPLQHRLLVQRLSVSHGGPFSCLCVCVLPSILFFRKRKSRFLSPGLLWRISSGNCLHSVRRWLDLSPPCREEWLPNGISSYVIFLVCFLSQIHGGSAEERPQMGARCRGLARRKAFLMQEKCLLQKFPIA
jgi:hypothetical protein